MKVKGKHYRSVWMEGTTVKLIEQNKLPFEFAIYEAKSYIQTCHAIKTMITRGAGAIGGTAGYAMAQAAIEASKSNYESEIQKAKRTIEATRPTAYDLFYTVNKVYEAALISPESAMLKAQEMADLNAEAGRKMGEFGSKLLSNNSRILTHCNAGWLAFVDYGSALSPVYVAQEQGKNIFVYADETRPRSQGARLTAWELLNQEVEHAIIPDNAAAYYMSKGKIDMLITGADRIAANGDVANKIGTLEKAIAAKYYGIPFYVTAPISTIDPHTLSGKDINIEQRSDDEVTKVTGPDEQQNFHTISITNPGSPVLNPAFDVTPASLVTGIITEKGIIEPTKEDISQLLNK
ncbi:MAG: S-methyl-5-thioribose-1-phosphate isomerase [Salinivirgaceae bacterium]|nr:MAG: S-methyl-5-thioribose-1-phosphate isomerase [Salinivirgaceae bacterium]